MATMTLRGEVTELLQELIRVDTTNPPGNETRAAELLRDYLEDHGVACELYARVPERANLVARIPGRGSGPNLLLLSHTDVVLADPTEWQLDPFGGEVRSGEVWGRGALDMKGQVAAEAVAIASLAREGFEPSGDLIFAATADEEVGAGFGAQWLCEAHPEAVRADYCINEGGGDRFVLDGKACYACSTAEKMSAPFRLRVTGRSGHASMPNIADNALVKAAPLIEKLGAYRAERRLIPEVQAMLQIVTGEAPTSAEEALARARAISPVFADLVEPLLAMTLSPTMAIASQKRNVIPASRPTSSRRSCARSSATATTSSRCWRRTAARVRRSSRRSGIPSRRSSRRPSRVRVQFRPVSPASRTATGSARRSEQLRTASFPRAQWTSS